MEKKVDYQKLYALQDEVLAIVFGLENSFYLTGGTDNWQDILKISHKKSIFEKEILIYRIESFPLLWLKNIKIINSIEITKEMVQQLNNDNSLKNT